VNNTITVGPHDALAVRSITGIHPRWTSQRPRGRWFGWVQLRAHSRPLAAQVAITSGRIDVVLDEAASGVAPGQAVVLYDGTRVIGSATIAGTRC